MNREILERNFAGKNKPSMNKLKLNIKLSFTKYETSIQP